MLNSVSSCANSVPLASLPVLHCGSMIPCTLAATGLLARLLRFIAIFSVVRVRECARP